MHVTAVLLAAGSSRRFKADKLMAPYRGRALFLHALDALVSTTLIAETILVVTPRFTPPGGLGRCRVVVNPDHDEGMGSSLRAGIFAAPLDAEAFVIAMADMPALTPDLIGSLIDYAEKSPKGIITPVYKGQRGHPVVIKAHLRSLLLGIEGDVGAREIIERHPETVGFFETDDPAVVFDVDTPDDLGRAGS
jgi:molybdenum cofactor cytidylyltransferase